MDSNDSGTAPGFENGEMSPRVLPGALIDNNAHPDVTSHNIHNVTSPRNNGNHLPVALAINPDGAQQLEVACNAGFSDNDSLKNLCDKAPGTAPSEHYGNDISSYHPHCAPPILAIGSNSAECTNTIPTSTQPLRNLSQPSQVHHYHPDLPFLVTHWISHYSPLSEESLTSKEMLKTPEITTAGNDEVEKKIEALRRIRHSAINLAWAFETLGAFGSSSHVITPCCRATTYSDLSRKFGPFLSIAFSCHRNHYTDDRKNGRVALLDALVSSSSLSHEAAAKNDLKCKMPWSLLEAACEGLVPNEGIDFQEERAAVSVLGNSELGSCRRVLNSLAVDAETTMDCFDPYGDIPGSLMQNPFRSNDKLIHVALASRQELSLRNKVAYERREIESTMYALNSTMESRTGQSNLSSIATRRLVEQSDGDTDLDLRRIESQLKHQLKELLLNHSCIKSQAEEAKRKTEKSYRHLVLQSQNQDSYQINGKHASLHQVLPMKLGQRNVGFGAPSHTPGKNKIMLAAILARQYHCRYQLSSFTQTNLSVLKSRLSHAVTISCHLIYPIYCLRFDRSGNYFITGADDQVVKVFHMGASKKEVCRIFEENRYVSLNYGANMRGAVLVCTLRGHAGVVTDIDVSVDNALLATASGDGDVRVWGLKDGCPVAILRGHKEGANMVSWSTISPFRLVTCGEDGVARMWDVRKAALKRYGDFMCSLSHNSSPRQENNAAHHENDNFEQGNRPQRMLPGPSLPHPQGELNDTDGNLAGIGFTGDFVANNRIDEGVTLIAQLQHGPITEESRLQGRVTRTGKKAVRVMCIARCPVGGHFATGSDDGLGHVWADDDDWRVERLDHELSEFECEDSMACHAFNSVVPRRKTQFKSSNAPSRERLLATLRGHSNAVTDMKYSSAGDRILTASMKDGVVCIWSWGKEGAVASVGNSTTSDFQLGPVHAKFSNVSQLFIELTPASRQKAALSSSSHHVCVNCDGVAWTCDDLKVVTSQSSPAKANSTDIIAGSHMIYVWDSHLGQCLMGILSSHHSLCSALATHPTLSSVVASAGSDGVVNIWDLERGDCFCTHVNSLLHGPVEPATNRGKRCGYLEVQFSPDGLNLVLTDENGRVTILDTLLPANSHEADTTETARYAMRSRALVSPAWMGEQYFANDYYELIYDPSGYCIERGSEQPPHLAPGGVRCTHEGVSYNESVRDTYRTLEGPLPLSDSSVRWCRDYVRTRSAQLRSEGGLVSQNVCYKGKKVVKSPELAFGCESTAIITTRGELVHNERKELSRRVSGANGNQNSNNSTTTGRQLSSRYRWVDFDDLSESEEENEDQDDEDYEGIGPSSYHPNLEESSAEGGSGVSSFVRSRPRQQRSISGRDRIRQSRYRQSSTAEANQEQRQQARASSRQTARRTYFELNSDDEQLNEMMSAHSKPSGKFVEDWIVSQHFFKMPRGEGSLVRRNWLSRTSYQGDCLGRKFYCPQVGDSVVYIPRAHYDTIRKYPDCGYSQPWKSWPTCSSWPVVCCNVTHVRYRFPYKMYYRSHCRDEKLLGVSAILTLEISGVPSTSGQNFPWPTTTFIPIASRTHSHEIVEFDVTVFECNEDDFIIPLYLYSWRIEELERAIVANDGNVDGLSVTVYCPLDHGDYDQDADHSGYTGRLVSMNETREDELHFLGSGYNALSMRWDIDEDSEDMDELAVFCVWNITVNNPSCAAPVVPTMGENARRAVKAALHSVINLDPKVNEWFYDHVDTSQFTDYLEMIEVPMHLSLIQKRLGSNYYTNKVSVLADMELVKENCYKYTEDGNEFYELACLMYDKFKSLVDFIEDTEGVCQMHREISSYASVDNFLGTEQSQRPVLSTSRVWQNHVGEGSAEAFTQAGTDSEISAWHHQGMLQSSRKPSGEAMVAEMSGTKIEHQEVAQRIRRSSQRLLSTEAGSPSRRISSRARANPRYIDKGSEEEDILESSDSDDETDEVSNKEAVSSNKRKRGHSIEGALRKKRGRVLSHKKGSHSYPDLAKWPPVPRRKISQVGLAVLSKLRDLDNLNLFFRPVCEEFPNIKEEYLREVKNPMDFRTIENERLCSYGHISELQEDLILTFRNCCIYNGEKTEYHCYALKIWQRLNDIFYEAYRD